jgi:N-methylhydantoinase B/oxoprolinase/acetone carboxylase alpha subunit
MFMGKGDRMIIHTPGGGGWGTKKDVHQTKSVPTTEKISWAPRGSLAEREAVQAAF